MMVTFFFGLRDFSLDEGKLLWHSESSLGGSTVDFG
jgi:hypothetical protein